MTKNNEVKRKDLAAFATWCFVIYCNKIHTAFIVYTNTYAFYLFIYCKYGHMLKYMYKQHLQIQK